MPNNEDEVKKAWSPPYVPFRTLLNLIEKMENEGVPNQIDKSFLSNLSGGTQSHLWASMRALDLMDEKQAPTGVMRSLVTAGDARPTHFKELLTAKMPWAVALGTTATHKELVDAFGEHSPNLSGATRDKAVSFYLAAAAYSGVPLSKWFRSKPGSGSSAQKRAPRKRRASGNAKRAEDQSQQNGDSTIPTSFDEMRAAYFTALLDKVKAGDGDADLLDRIEKLLAIEGTPK